MYIDYIRIIGLPEIAKQFKVRVAASKPDHWRRLQVPHTSSQHRVLRVELHERDGRRRYARHGVGLVKDAAGRDVALHSQVDGAVEGSGTVVLA